MHSEVNIAVIDIECTCDAEGYERNQYEIIEVGAVAALISGSDFKITDQLQLYVRPTVNPVLSAFCTALTGIEQATVNAASPLSDALVVLEEWLNKNRTALWISWGKSDDKHFKIECETKSLRNPLANIFYCNAKQIFARKFNHRVGLSRALKLRNLEFLGQHHTGIDDARNIANLLASENILREAIVKRYEAKTFL